MSNTKNNLNGIIVLQDENFETRVFLILVQNLV